MRHLLAVVALVAAVGCGGGGGSVSMGDVPAKFSHAYCTKAFECCTSAEIAVQFGFFNPPITTEAECETTYTSLISGFFASEQAGITAGKIVYHGDAAGSCIDNVSSESCAEFAANTNGDCKAAFTGTVATGTTCANDDECTTGYCMGATTQPPVNGTCADKPTNGQACPDFTCADGSFCDFSMQPPMCATPKADGMSCNSADECASHGCNGGNPMMGMPGTCGAPTMCDGQ